MRKIEEIEEIEENEETEVIEESCGILWHYIVHQTSQIPLDVQQEVQASRVFGTQQHMDTRMLNCIPSFWAHSFIFSSPIELKLNKWNQVMVRVRGDCKA